MIRNFLFCVLATAALTASLSAQQLFLNRAFQSASGNPFFNPLLGNLTGQQWSKTIVSGSGGIITVGYTSVSGQGQNIYLIKYAPAGTIVFQQNLNSSGSNNDYGIGVAEASNGDILVCGTTDNGGSTNYNVFVARFSTTGALLDSVTRSGPSNKNDIAVAIKEDAMGNVIVAANTEAAFGFFDYWVVKFTPALNYMSDNIYDYTGLHDVVIGFDFAANGDIALIGASASGTASCDYAEAVFDASSLAFVSDSRNNIPGTALDNATSFCKDASNNIFMTGRAWNGTDFDIKTIKISSNLTIAWTATLDVHGLDDAANSIAADPLNGDVIIGGYATKTNAKKELICIRLNSTSGATISIHAQSAENSTGDAYIKKLDVNAVGDVYFVAGEKGNSGIDQVLVGKIKPSGSPAWQRQIVYGTQTVLPSDIQVASDGIYVISVLDSTIDSYLTTKYTELEFDTARIFNGNGNAACKKRELIVGFLPTVIDSAAIDNLIGSKIMEFGTAQDFLTVPAAASFASALEEYCRDCQVNFARIYKGMRTTDTISESRLGQNIPVPDFWSTLLLEFPSGITIQLTVFPFRVGMNLEGPVKQFIGLICS